MKKTRNRSMFLYFVAALMLFSCMVDGLPVRTALAGSAVSDTGTLRDIYGTQPGNDGFYHAAALDNENSRVEPESVISPYSGQYSLGMKFSSGQERSVVGIRFVMSDGTPEPFEISPQMRVAGGVEFWIDPTPSEKISALSVGLVSDSSGEQVETRLPVSRYANVGAGNDKWTRVVVPFRDFSVTGSVYDSAASRTAPEAFDWNSVLGLNFAADTTANGAYSLSVDNIRFITSTIKPVSVQGQQMVTDSGDPVRFWGMNLTSSYPPHEQADKLAANLSSLGINVIRHHHNNRNSLDWNVFSKIGSLAAYQGNTRDPNPEAWDRYDYLNARLRDNGIYLQLTLDSTRRYLPGDVDILQTNEQDRASWMAAVDTLNKIPSNLDLVRILPMIDERAALLMEEYAKRMLTHMNPYTGIAYGQDPQVLYLEVMNETSSEYGVIAGNKFDTDKYPAVAYWKNLLNDKWSAYTAAHGIEPCEFYSPVTEQQKLARGDFLRELDRNYFNRIKNVAQSLNVRTPIIFSNLWRGESFQKMQAELSDVIEDHQYVNPSVVNDFDDVFNFAARSAIAGKPYFIGELNQRQGVKDLIENAPYRTMLPLAMSAYGSFLEWSGVSWFAWSHGDRMLGKDGWSLWEDRWLTANPTDMIGEIGSDAMMIDHLRTTGMLFRQGLTAKSAEPVNLYVDEPTGATSYQTLMSPKYQFKPGWQNIHDIRRAFGPVPETQPIAEWMTTSPPNPLVSDTGEIVKDTVRKQLTVAAPKAEAFSGKLDGQPPAGLKHLQLEGDSGFATVVAVSNDGNEWSDSRSIIVSRTALDADNNEVDGPAIRLNGLKPETETMAWHIKRTRPRGETGYEELAMPTPGELTLPADVWHECELEYAPRGSLPARQSTIRAGDTIRPVFDDNFLLSGVLGSAQGGFSLDSGYVIDGSGTVVPAEGSKSMRLKFTAGSALSRVGIHFTNYSSNAVMLDFTGTRSTAGVRFQLYAKRKVDSFSLVLASDNNGKLVENRIPLAAYLNDADYGNRWVEVTIPFADFPDMGVHYDSTTGETTPMPFLWNQVKGIGFSTQALTDGYYDPQVDDIRIVYTAVPAP